MEKSSSSASARLCMLAHCIEIHRVCLAVCLGACKSPQKTMTLFSALKISHLASLEQKAIRLAP